MLIQTPRKMHPIIVLDPPLTTLIYSKLFGVWRGCCVATKLFVCSVYRPHQLIAQNIWCHC